MCAEYIYLHKHTLNLVNITISSLVNVDNKTNNINSRQIVARKV